MRREYGRKHLRQFDGRQNHKSTETNIPARHETRSGEHIMANNVSELTDANFQNEVLQSEQPVLVDFWAPWCGPCRMIAPMVEELAGENRGSFKVGKINIDDNPQAAQNYGVNSIPTLMIFKGGEVVDRFVGVQPKNRLQQAIDSAKT
jgi:thioredoxin 1